MNTVPFPQTAVGIVYLGVVTVIIASLIFYLFRPKRRRVAWIVLALAVLSVFAIDLAPTAEPEAPQDVMLRGVVQDEDGRPVPNVRVHIVGYGPESVRTDRQGTFALQAHAAAGQEVRVRTELAGFEPTDQHHLLGEVPMTIRVVKVAQ